jgi:hypothetical protein
MKTLVQVASDEAMVQDKLGNISPFIWDFPRDATEAERRLSAAQVQYVSS